MGAGRDVAPLIVLEYDSGPAYDARTRGDRVGLLISAALLGAIGLGLGGGTVELLVRTWPVFGLTLIVALPVGLIAAAFLALSYTAVWSALSPESIESPVD